MIYKTTRIYLIGIILSKRSKRSHKSINTASYHLYAFPKQPKPAYNVRGDNISYFWQVWVVGSETKRA